MPPVLAASDVLASVFHQCFHYTLAVNINQTINLLDGIVPLGRSSVNFGSNGNSKPLHTGKGRKYKLLLFFYIIYLFATAKGSI